MTLKDVTKKTMNSSDKLMDVLQDHGVVSDETVHWSDVPESDKLPALRFLKTYFKLC